MAIMRRSICRVNFPVLKKGLATTMMLCHIWLVDLAAYSGKIYPPELYFEKR